MLNKIIPVQQIARIKRAHLVFYNWNEHFSFADCLASYATETVMQYCHGRRKCSLTADQKTFGKPCLPESRMYLKVVYTCGKLSWILKQGIVSSVVATRDSSNVFNCSQKRRKLEPNCFKARKHAKWGREPPTLFTLKSFSRWALSWLIYGFQLKRSLAFYTEWKMLCKRQQRPYEREFFAFTSLKSVFHSWDFLLISSFTWHFIFLLCCNKKIDREVFVVTNKAELNASEVVEFILSFRVKCSDLSAWNFKYIFSSSLILLT